MLLDATAGFHVIAETGDDAATVHMVRQQKPNILLLDWEMSRRNGMKILSELAASGLSACILLITAASDATDVARAIQFGAKGILSSETTEESLREAIHKVLKGQYVLGQAAVSSLVGTATGPRPTTAFQNAKRKFGITRREFDVISEVVAGYSTAEISARLSLSSNTLKHHMSHIFDKLGVSNRLELVLFSVHHIVRDMP
jgi:two-component system nitrate/nitrite response regulator NarL